MRHLGHLEHPEAGRRDQGQLGLQDQLDPGSALAPAAEAAHQPLACLEASLRLAVQRVEVA